MRKLLPLPLLFILSALLSIGITADEGMYPLSEIGKLNLKAKGLKIDVKEIYNPEGVSLVQAICEVGMGGGGGTGEFVSPDGLILTNHHIAFPAVAAASTPEKDYLKNGFTAFTREMEIPAKNYTCQITESYRDVTSDVMSVVKDGMQPSARATAIRAKMNEIARAEEGKQKNVSCEVAEMFPGRSYVLFTSRSILDVRLVYVPPLGVGNFGGENDNWMWPRHTGDFSFLRAYVAPDGSTAAYSQANVPFTPKRHIKVATKGVKEGDFVMILGYPGRTYRHKTSHFLRLQESVQLPAVSRRFDWMISTMEQMGEGDRALQIKFADEMKSYANVTKNYKGKLQGMRRLALVSKKVEEERQLQAFIEADPARREKYGTVISEIGRVYEQQQEYALQEFAFAMLGRNKIIGTAMALLTGAEAKDRKPEVVERAKAGLAARFDDMHLGAEEAFLARSILDVAALPRDQRFLQSISVPSEGSAREREAAVLLTVRDAVSRSAFAKMETLVGLADLTREALIAVNDPVIAMALDYRTAMEKIRERQRAREGELNRLEGALLDAKMLWRSTQFIPDANSTLRFTYGYVRGYAPADATRHSPLSTLRGIAEKQTGEEPFDAPVQLIDLYNTRSYDKSFEDKTLGEVPVAMLYNMDTTGGNSGSPVLNAYGELVGVNFDRTFEATINDYQWSESYSRSIGADIRYILFVAKYIGKADFLLKELGVRY